MLLTDVKSESNLFYHRILGMHVNLKNERIPGNSSIMQEEGNSDSERKAPRTQENLCVLCVLRDEYP